MFVLRAVSLLILAVIVRCSRLPTTVIIASYNCYGTIIIIIIIKRPNSSWSSFTFTR